MAFECRLSLVTFRSLELSNETYYSVALVLFLLSSEQSTAVG